LSVIKATVKNEGGAPAQKKKKKKKKGKRNTGWREPARR
jgi:hypothetical protein